MAIYNLAFNARVDGFAVLQPFVQTDIQSQDTVTLTGVVDPPNGSYLVLSSEPYEFIGVSNEGDFLFDYDIVRENQFIVASTGTDFERTVATGTVTVGATLCTWIVAQDVLDWLGVSPASANDLVFVTACTGAANALAYRRRKSSGYTDALATAPGADVKLGTVMMAGNLYRNRGSAGGESFMSYESMQAGGSPLAMGEILRLWGCNRAQVA